MRRSAVPPTFRLDMKPPPTFSNAGVVEIGGEEGRRLNGGFHCLPNRSE
jgi:hypothetical protein